MGWAEHKPFEWPDCIVTQESAWGGLIHFVPDDVEVVELPRGLFMGWGTLRRYEPGVIYRASELEHLISLEISEKDLRVIHQVKKTFGGEVKATLPRPKRLWTEEEVVDAWAAWSTAQRDRYLELRLRTLRRLETSEAEANLQQRTLAASWAAERVHSMKPTSRRTPHDEGYSASIQARG